MKMLFESWMTRSLVYINLVLINIIVNRGVVCRVVVNGTFQDATRILRNVATDVITHSTFRRMCAVPITAISCTAQSFACPEHITNCQGFHIQSKNNNSSATATHHNFDNYLHPAINESRNLEEIIYSDIINNIQGVLRTESDDVSRSANHSVNFKHTGSRVKDDCHRSEDDVENKSSLQEFVKTVNSFAKNVLLNNGNDFGNVKETGYRFDNSEPRNSNPLTKYGYVLGYSGNPFGSRKTMAQILQLNAKEMSMNDTLMADMRRKRSVLHLYSMVLCATGCDPFAYKGYGCYCGFLGSGFVVDGIDSCCKMHDWCYNSAGCPPFLEYFIPYLWKCYHHQPLCAIDHGFYGGSGSCAQRLCECDRQLALCLRRFPCPTTKALCTSSPWRLLQNILML